jgi:DNA repair protein RadC
LELQQLKKIRNSSPLPSSSHCSSVQDRLTRRIIEASKVLQLQLIDHVIIGSPAPGRSSYFSFKEGGVIS